MLIGATRPALDRRPVTPTTQTVIGVLGMHRSGTSCLAGTLEEAGVYLGEVFRKNRHNAKGNRENPRIIDLHDRILRDNGGSWDDPPAQVVWSDEHRRERDEIIDSYRKTSRWGFKDPRTLLALDGWLEALPRMRLVGLYRHPALVARSLQSRNEFPIERGIALWTHYNERLLAYRARYDFPIISFDLEEDAFRDRLVQVLRHLELSAGHLERSRLRALVGRLPLVPSSGDLAFFEPALRHHLEDADAVPLPERTMRVFEELKRLSL